MGDLVPLYDPLNYVRALKRIQKLWVEGDVEITEYAQKRMNERGFIVSDLQRIINSGHITEHMQCKNTWRYTIKGKSVDGVLANCVVEVNGRLIIVTLYYLSKKKGPK